MESSLGTLCLGVLPTWSSNVNADVGAGDHWPHRGGDGQREMGKDVRRTLLSCECLFCRLSSGALGCLVQVQRPLLRGRVRMVCSAPGSPVPVGRRGPASLGLRGPWWWWRRPPLRLTHALRKM